jgi:hypothetical protein
MVNYEVKGQLAKLLATEDLIIENRKVSTASFDVHRRILTLPLWERASGVVYDLLVGHEVGHALYTPDIDWTKEYPEVPKNFVNVFEDVRVERKMKNKFAGLAKTFYNGYSELSADDFFGIADENVDGLGFVDRINLYFKIGNFVDIEFSDEEIIFVQRAYDTNTFDDVLKLSQDVFNYLKEKSQHTESVQPQENSSQSQQDSDEKESTPQEANSEEKGESPSNQQSPSFESDSNEQPEKQESRGGDEFETITDSNLEDNIESLTTNNTFYSPTYAEIPLLDLNKFVASNSDIHEYLSRYYTSYEEKVCQEYDILNPYSSIDSEYTQFRNSAQKEVNYLVKEFECRKAADSYSRATTARTGVLDCTKLHTYKYNEDLFKKVTTLADGKNHGLIFVLDWSGSMSDVFLDTIKQLYNLIWFCRKLNIPFDVYAFTNEWKRGGYYKDEYLQPDLEYPCERKDGEFQIDNSFSMMQILTSSCRKSDMENQLRNIFRLANSLDSRCRYQCLYQYPSRLGLSGTPLNEAIISLNSIIPDFFKRNKIQKVQTIVLTDGEACYIKINRSIYNNDGSYAYMGVRSVIPGNTYIRDRITGQTFKIGEDHQDTTTALLNQLRSRFPNMNFIGMRLLNSRDTNSFIRRYTKFDHSVSEKLIETYRKTKSFVLNDVGYHAYFGLSSSALSNDVEFEVKEDATKSQIKSAFAKSLKGKKMNKKILGEFINFIA